MSVTQCEVFCLKKGGSDGGLAAGHIKRGDAADRKSRLLHVVAHTDGSTVTLINAIDEKIGERCVGVGKLSSSYDQQNGRGTCEVHFVVAVVLNRFLLSRNVDSINER